MIRAARTPGTQPKTVKINTIKTEPQPLSKTARGGMMMDNKTRQKLIIFLSKIIKMYQKNKKVNKNLY